ncbi:hypothetical protein [Nakamurella lactea]|uniref:hypothetical protein n=1 Tax=Nakamurella lactea TaxID=459515 RepID=UPI0012B6791F|nr:hypothetical protein [Nakamurella lactea]
MSTKEVEEVSVEFGVSVLLSTVPGARSSSKKIATNVPAQLNPGRGEHAGRERTPNGAHNI